MLLYLVKTAEANTPNRLSQQPSAALIYINIKPFKKEPAKAGLERLLKKSCAYTIPLKKLDNSLYAMFKTAMLFVHGTPYS